MELLFWIIVIVIIIAFFKKGPSEVPTDSIDRSSENYIQGYQDGYQAHKDGLKFNPRGVDYSETISQKPAVVMPTSTSSMPSYISYDKKVVNESPKVSNIPRPVQNISEPVVIDTQQPTVSSKEQKEKHDLQNINTALYIASFLLVAAAALFVGTSLPESIRFIGVWIITIAFYAVGLILYDNIEKLRPAAVAFVGTGLALLPFTGIAMNSFILHDAAACWFITSAIGLVAYIIAAICLRNQIVSYLAIAFGISLATSSVAILHAGLIWYFVVSIIFGSLMTILAKVQPNLKWVPDCFTRPIQESNSWIVPLTIFASLFAYTGMTIRDYWIVSLISAIYYGAVAASSTKERDVAIFISRFLASMTALLMAYDIFDTWTAVGLTMSVTGIIQLAVSTMFLPKYVAGDDNNETWLWIGLAMQLFAPVFVMGNVSWAIIVTGQLSALLIMSFGLSYSLRRAIISVFGTVALAILPILVCMWVAVPRLDNNWISLIFIVFAMSVLIVRYAKKSITDLPQVRPYLVANFGLFIVEALYFTYDVSNGWGLALWSMATILIYGLMYIERQPWLSILTNAMILVSISRFVVPTLESHWVASIFVVMAIISITFLSFEKFMTTSLSIRPYLVANFGLFTIEALAYTFQIEAGWGLAIWLVSTALVYWLMYLERQPWLSVLANVMIWVSIMRFVEPTLELNWVALIFMVLALLTIAILSFERHIILKVQIRPCLVTNFILFTVQSLALTVCGMSEKWALLFWSIASLMVYLLIYLERQPWVSIVANLMMLISTVLLLDIMNIPDDWVALVVSWVAFVVFYGVYWILEILPKRQYGIYFWWSAITVTGLINICNLMNDNDHISVAAGLGLVAVSAAIIIDGWRAHKLFYIDFGVILATVGLQRILYIVAPDTNLLVYTHWWAAMFALLGYMYYSFGMKVDAKSRIIVALSFVSLFTGMSALGTFGDSDIPYRTIFLIEHILIIISGLILAKKLFTIWGAVGVILAVLWMIRDYTFLLLAFAAFVLIGAAIFALIKRSGVAK